MFPAVAFAEVEVWIFVGTTLGFALLAYACEQFISEMSVDSGSCEAVVASVYAACRALNQFAIATDFAASTFDQSGARIRFGRTATFTSALRCCYAVWLAVVLCAVVC